MDDRVIPYGRQSINEHDVEAVVAVLRGELLTTGPAVHEFEASLAAVAGAPCVAVSSGTAALHSAYSAAGIGPGDEVITPAITFVATQAAACALGATIRFADVQADTANIDPEHVAALITDRTRAIVAVDFAGQPADLFELRDLAVQHGLLLIEDAAHSLGSLYRGRPVGSIADLTTFSFFPTKNITTAEGGAIASPNEALLKRVKVFRNQGLVREPDSFQLQGEGAWHQEVHEFGLNYRLPDVLAALGNSQLQRLGYFKARRQQIAARYLDFLADLDGIVLPTQREYVDPMWHLFPIRVLGDQRRRVFDQMRSVGIGVQVNYIPAYWHPAFAELGYKRGLCPVAEEFYHQEISLPMHPSLTDDEVDFVIGELRRAVS